MLLVLHLGLINVRVKLAEPGCCTMLGLNLGISSVSTKHAPDFLCVSSYQTALAQAQLF
jgi:hypothetical protein